jgi:putative phosphoesterase
VIAAPLTATQNAGMRIAVIADVHANLPALRAVLADAERIGCQAVWSLGDLVGRGPYPNQVVDEIRRREVVCIQGNWDEAVAQERDHPGAVWDSDEAEAAGIACLEWTTATMTDENRSFLRQQTPTMRFELEGRSVLLFHGSPVRQNEYLWSDLPSRRFTRIAEEEGDDLFCFGHTHQSFHKALVGGHFVAAGSVGCGGAGDARARYAVIYLTASELVVGFRSVDYDRRAVLEAQRAAGLSPDLVRVPPHHHLPVPPSESPTFGEARPGLAAD